MAKDDMLLAAEELMEKAVEFFKQELRTVRTGRASTGLVDGVRVAVESYGSTMALKELAALAVAEGNVIVIKPYDPGTLKDIQKALEKSELGINPQNDGKLIRLPVPPLSTERRQQLAAHVRQLGESQKVAIRNCRRDANKAFEAAEKAKSLTEDEAEQGQKQVQELTDQYCKEVDRLIEEKTKDIMTV